MTSLEKMAEEYADKIWGHGTDCHKTGYEAYISGFKKCRELAVEVVNSHVIAGSKGDQKSQIVKTVIETAQEVGKGVSALGK